jgi:hypothetical protein
LQAHELINISYSSCSCSRIIDRLLFGIKLGNDQGVSDKPVVEIN